MTTLEEKTNQVNREREHRHPLLDVRENRKELRLIAERAQEYIREKAPELADIRDWAAIPRVAISVLTEMFVVTHKMMLETKNDVSIQIGDFMTIGIEYLGTNGDKDGNLTPVIIPGPELDYNRELTEYDDAIPVDMKRELEDEGLHYLLPQFYDIRTILNDMFVGLLPVLESDYGIVISDWSVAMLIFAAFFRMAKQYLVEHKDDGEYGLVINLAEAAFIEITKDGTDEDPIYAICVTPGQTFKKDYAKGDNLTEE